MTDDRGAFALDKLAKELGVHVPTLQSALNRRMLRRLVGFVLAMLVLVAAAFWVTGPAAPPQITIEQPSCVVGQPGSVDVVVEAPSGRWTSLIITVDQSGRTIPPFSLDAQ